MAHDVTQGAGGTAVVFRAASELVSEISSELRSSSAAGVVALSMMTLCVFVWLTAFAVFFVGIGAMKGRGDVFTVITSFLSFGYVVGGILIRNISAGLGAGEVSFIQHAPLMNIQVNDSVHTKIAMTVACSTG